MGDGARLALLNGLNRLSGEKRAEILGMVKALAFAQLGEGRKAPAPADGMGRRRGRAGSGKPGGEAV